KRCTIILPDGEKLIAKIRVGIDVAEFKHIIHDKVSTHLGIPQELLQLYINGKMIIHQEQIEHDEMNIYVLMGLKGGVRQTSTPSRSDIYTQLDSTHESFACNCNGACNCHMFTGNLSPITNQHKDDAKTRASSSTPLRDSFVYEKSPNFQSSSTIRDSVYFEPSSPIDSVFQEKNTSRDLINFEHSSPIDSNNGISLSKDQHPLYGSEVEKRRKYIDNVTLKRSLRESTQFEFSSPLEEDKTLVSNGCETNVFSFESESDSSVRSCQRVDKSKLNKRQFKRKVSKSLFQ
ncbi:unnamed protein product, partial [Owenia fusiformis]